MMKAFKYRIYPSKIQEHILAGWLGQTRFIWNLFLEQNIKRYEKEKKFIFKFDLNNQLPELKKQYDWIDAPAQTLQQIGFQLDSALRNCYKRKMGFPKFKRKGKESGIQIPQQRDQIKSHNENIKIPKIGNIRWRYHRETLGNLKSITITRDVDQWYISCLCDVNEEIDQKEIMEETSIGIDLGLKYFAVMSNGEIIDNPKFLFKSEKQLKKEQRKLARKKKGSANRNKQRIKCAKRYRKIRFQLKNFLHQVSHAIAKMNSCVFVEDLAVKNMMKNHKLARSISQVGWSQFITYLTYKMNWSNGELIKIGRFDPSSQLCSSCGNQQKMPLSIRTYDCPSCGISLDRDLNAARNILQLGLTRAGIARSHACGDTSIGEVDMSTSRFVSVKQEATSFRA